MTLTNFYFFTRNSKSSSKRFVEKSTRLINRHKKGTYKKRSTIFFNNKSKEKLMFFWSHTKINGHEKLSA